MAHSGPGCAVAALAGRRIDRPDERVPRFPVGCIPHVGAALAELIEGEQIRALVCSAACGADLLALNAALRLGVRCRVVLPYSPIDFRHTSVTDRPGEWGSAFDDVIATVAEAGDLIVLDEPVGDDRSFSRVNEAIISEALELADASTALAIVVWEGQPRTPNDRTAEFQRLAERAGMDLRSISTCQA